LISSSSSNYRESFNSYYNNGLPPSFNVFQDTFSQNQGSAPDNSWNITSGYWLVKNGVYNGTETNGYQENMISYADIGKADISMVANVYINRKVNTTASYTDRVGIFTHYSAKTTASYKWALVLVDDGTAKTLRLLDEMNSWGPSVSCPFSTGVWYTFNLTIHGFQAIGAVSSQGQNLCPSVSWTFPTNSPATGGTSFGLYAGGYSALFDNVQVTRVTPYITGAGFSNSFVQTGAPGPTGLNTWLATTKPPGQGWNTTANWLPATGWSQAYAVQNYGGPYWNSGVNGWTDNNAQWIWWSRNSNFSAAPDPVWFRRIFTVNTATTLNIQATADNMFVVYVDGTRCAIQNNGDWTTPRSCTTQTLQPGVFHVLAANATNPDGQSPTQPNPDPAGFLLTASANGRFLFRTDGQAGPVISALAGKAELQNGVSSVPEETYYSYYSWGGLNQTRTRYDPPAAQGSSNPLALDGSGMTNCSNHTSSCSVTLSTAHSNDIIMVYATETLDQQTSCIFSISDTANLDWFNRTNVIYARSGRDQLQEFYARSTSILSSDTITESILNCGLNYNGLQVFAISGANFNIPFDQSFGVPGTNQGDNTVPITNATTTISNPNDFVFASVQHGTGAVPTAQSGFSSIIMTAGYGSEYKVTGNLVSNFPVMFNFGTCSYYFCPWEETADAVQSTPSTQWLSTSRTYDTYGNLNTTINPNGNKIYFSFGSNYANAYLTNQTRVNGAVKITTLYAYNFTTGNLQIVTDPMGNATNYQNDNLGRATRVSYPLGAYAQYSYNDRSNYVDVTNENGWKTRQIYDGLARQTFTDRFLNGVSYSNQTYSYNWQDKVTSQSDALGN
ncbi:MAG TPA: hypothetical protein VFE96_02635, partial [Candidatus Bathyarchaeia archaeon]|nr:hypothetical protein [Candidatus Bathyarchaeia archaeon]